MEIEKGIVQDFKYFYDKKLFEFSLETNNQKKCQHLRDLIQLVYQTSQALKQSSAATAKLLQDLLEKYDKCLPAMSKSDEIFSIKTNRTVDTSKWNTTLHNDVNKYLNKLPCLSESGKITSPSITDKDLKELFVKNPESTLIKDSLSTEKSLNPSQPPPPATTTTKFTFQQWKSSGQNSQQLTKTQNNEENLLKKYHQETNDHRRRVSPYQVPSTTASSSTSSSSSQIKQFGKNKQNNLIHNFNNDDDEMLQDDKKITKPPSKWNTFKSNGNHNNSDYDTVINHQQRKPDETNGNKPISKWNSFKSNGNHNNAVVDNETVINHQQKKQPDEPNGNGVVSSSFKTGREELIVQQLKKYGASDQQQQQYKQKSLGGRRNVKSNFIPPFLQQQEPSPMAPKRGNQPFDKSTDLRNHQNQSIDDNNEPTDTILDDPRLKHIDPKMVELIKSEIMDTMSATPIHWDDIAGLEYAKSTIKEAVVWPLLRPDIFTGLRRPPRGILLFGPPGTGKTLIGKCIAAQSKSTFFSISASSLTSKWIGDGEKMVRALFAVASVYQPAVVFIDEIDSLLCQRSETEHESSRRIKTEFLVQLDGAATGDDERILIVGATNRPQELDEAARRRLVRRLYIPLPEYDARLHILENLLRKERTILCDAEIKEVSRLTDGFSGADMKTLCHEASMGPIRSISMDQMEHIDLNDVRPLNLIDFMQALKRVRPSVSPDDLAQYLRWDGTYGSGAMLKS